LLPASAIDTNSIEYRTAHHRADRCTIPILESSSPKQFLDSYFGHSPVILRGLGKNNPKFELFLHSTSIPRLRNDFANLSLTLATANTFSHQKQSMPLIDYIDNYLTRPVSINESADNILYWFGDHEEPKHEYDDGEDTGDNINNDEDNISKSLFGNLLARYPIPEHVFKLSSSNNNNNTSDNNNNANTFRYYSALNQPYNSRYSGRLSFGAGPAFSGTPFHYHSQVFAQMLHGKKRWFIFPPSNENNLNQEHPNNRFIQSFIIKPELSAIQWINSLYTNNLNGDNNEIADLLISNGLLECVLHSGDLLYLPDYWLHLTMNLEPSVFISIFMLDEFKTGFKTSHE